MNDDRQVSREKSVHEKGKVRLKWLLPIVIIAVGLAVMRGLIFMKKAPERIVDEERGQLVETAAVTRAEGRVRVVTHGSVTPFQKMEVVPRVSGYVVKDHLEAGKSFAEGEVLFTLDDVDYQLAAVKAEAQVKQAENTLADIRSRAASAKLEWERMPGRENMKPSALLMYEPQLAAAEAQLKGAKADLAARRLDIARCTVKAPFACRVTSEMVAPGQFISQGMTVASLVASEHMDLVVPVTAEELAWIDPEKAQVKVTSGTGDQSFSWRGRLVRRLADVDPDGRMARLLIRVDEPYRDEAHALVPNMYVTVEITGKQVTGALAVPPEALVDGKQLYVLTADSTLAVRDITVVRRQKDRILVSGEIIEGERVITSGVAGAAPGMKLRQWISSSSALQ